MSFEVEVDVDATQVIARLDEMQNRLGPTGLRVFFRGRVRPYLVRRMESRFVSEGDDASGKWQQLAFNTGRIRRAKGYPAWHPINRRSGALRRHVTQDYRIRPANGATLDMPGSPGGREMASKIKVAQRGGYPTSGKSARRGPSRPAPPRPVLAVNDRDATHVTIDLMAWLKVGRLP